MPARACVPIAGVAQLVEHLICNQRVRGSNPFASSRFANSFRIREIGAALQCRVFQRHSIRNFFLVYAYESDFVRSAFYRSAALSPHAQLPAY